MERKVLEGSIMQPKEGCPEILPSNMEFWEGGDP